MGSLGRPSMGNMGNLITSACVKTLDDTLSFPRNDQTNFLIPHWHLENMHLKVLFGTHVYIYLLNMFNDIRYIIYTLYNDKIYFCFSYRLLQRAAL